jgi:hypothetical protein
MAKQRAIQRRRAAPQGKRGPAIQPAAAAPELAAESAGLGDLDAVQTLTDPAAQHLRRATVQRASQQLGNYSVQRLLGQTIQRDAEQDAMRAFRARGMLPDANGVDKTSGTGIGGFNTRFDPGTGELLIRLRVGIKFLDSITITDPASGTIAPATGDFANAAQALRTNFPDPGARVAEVQSKYQWNGKEDAWRARYAQMAGDAWGEQHYFKSVRWPQDVFANVRVQLDVHSGHRPDDHCQATVYQVPDGFGDLGAVVNSTGNATGYTGTFTSAHLGVTDDFLNYRLEYPEGGTEVNQGVGATKLGQGDDGATYLNKLITDFKAGKPNEGPPITITGRARATGSHERNEQVAQQRAAKVSAFLQAGGIAADRLTATSTGDAGATADPAWRRAEIQIGDGRAQTTMIHETGHMLGLGDEYASPAGGFAPGAGTPGTIGQPVAHNALQGASSGVDGAVYENNDNIMSVGNVVRPQHYSTFLEALNSVAAPTGEAFVYGGPGTAPQLIPDLIRPYGRDQKPTEVPV